jgi:hypothetical protein
MEISECGSRRSRRLPDRRCSEISEKPAKHKRTAHQFFGEDDMKASHGILFPAVCGIFCVHFLLLGSVDALTAQQQWENAPASGPNAWNLKNIDNRMKNQQEVEGYLVQHPTPGSPEQLQVRASCDNSGMHWLIAYISGTRPAVGRQQNIPPGAVSSPRLWVAEHALRDDEISVSELAQSWATHRIAHSAMP